MHACINVPISSKKDPMPMSICGEIQIRVGELSWELGCRETEWKMKKKMNESTTQLFTFDTMSFNI